MKKESYFFFCV